MTASGDPEDRKKKHLDDKLDEALRETFPASDAIELTAGEEDDGIEASEPRPPNEAASSGPSPA